MATATISTQATAVRHRVHRRHRQRAERRPQRVDRRRVALHQRADRDDVTAHYDALQNQISVKVPSSNPLAPPQYLTTPTLNTQTITVTDPTGKNAVVHVRRAGRWSQATNPLGGVTYYGYDAAQRASTITDPDGDTTYLTYDAHNNVTSTTTCAAVNNCQTSYAVLLREPGQPARPAQRQADRLAGRPLLLADRPDLRHGHHLHAHRR